MLNSAVLAIIAGAVLGFLSGLGIGGGSLLILWLTLVQNTPVETARIINLMFFLPAAAIAIIFRCKSRQLKLRVILPALAAGIVGAFLLGILSAHWDTQALRKPFGILLLATGLREIFYRSRKENITDCGK